MSRAALRIPKQPRHTQLNTPDERAWQVMDKHLLELSKRHIETKFCKVRPAFAFNRKTEI